MNQNQINSSTQIEVVNDELDIKKLFVTLWQRKITVVLFTVFFAIVAYAGSYLMTPVWTATAILTKPSSNELGALSMIQQTVNSLDLSSTQKDVVLSVNDVVYHQFVELIASYDFKRNFWLGSDYYNEQIKSLNTDHEKAVLLENLIANIQFTALDERKGNLDTLVLKAETARLANDLLRNYITIANQTVIAKITQQTENTKTLMINNLTKMIEDLSESAETKYQSKLAALEARMVETQKNYNEISSRADVLPNEIELLRLTFEQLNTELAYLKSTGPEYDTRIDDYNLKLNELQKLPELKNLKQTFNFLRTPQEPVAADSPRRVFWAFLAALIGGFVGVCVALIRGPVRTTQAAS